MVTRTLFQIGGLGGTDETGELLQNTDLIQVQSDE